jgi:hypothetical protein
MTRIALSCLGWVSRAVVLSLSVLAVTALLVVSATLVAVMGMAIVIPAPTVLATRGRRDGRGQSKGENP